MRLVDRLLTTVEITSVVVAGIFGVMWARNPSGAYEPITFLALLIGGTGVEIVRRRVRSRSTNGSKSAFREQSFLKPAPAPSAEPVVDLDALLDDQSRLPLVHQDDFISDALACECNSGGPYGQ